ncbi:MAG: FHA domain-containing protein [Solirubrobacterales bacterium]|nr:FHA domain-containing protein [Solirubrobacterales bacterium]
MNRVADRPADLKERLGAERRGVPFVVFRDSAGVQRLIALDPPRDELTVGRAGECDVCLGWDAAVSRLHALLALRGGSWTLDDSGLSRNGTFLNGERVDGHCVLRDRDVLRAGATEIRFFDPSPQRTRTVTTHSALLETPALSPAQMKVLVALCAPYKGRSAFATPASNEAIAAQLVLSIDAVKCHLRTLFIKFGLECLPRTEKRIRLAEEAFARGIVRDSDLDVGRRR